jgi:uncharacterized protein Yka (UPF0111/DUF47 family)
MKLRLWFSIRRFVTEGFDMIQQMHNTLTNHVMSKLEEHDEKLRHQGEQLNHIEGKVDQIADRVLKNSKEKS